MKASTLRFFKFWFGSIGIIHVFAVVAVLSGCDIKINSSEYLKNTNDTEEVDLSSKLTYFKDKYDICYAVLPSTTYNGHIPNIVNSIAVVDCDKVNPIK